MKRFIHQDIRKSPAGSRIRSIVRGKHVLRVAFPKGPRRTGSGRLVGILHPRSENPRLCGMRRNPAELVILGNPRKRKKNPAELVVLANPRVKRTVSEQRKVSAQGAQLYSDFHGKQPNQVVEIQESALSRSEYVALGELIELLVRAPRGTVQLAFESDGIRLASNPEATQLYAIGGNQDISASLDVFGTDTSKDFVEMGEAKKIVYRGRKNQDGGALNDYVHTFGEETGTPPLLFFDKLRRRIFFVGGNYKIKDVGIVD